MSRRMELQSVAIDQSASSETSFPSGLMIVMIGSTPAFWHASHRFRPSMIVPSFNAIIGVRWPLALMLSDSGSISDSFSGYMSATQCVFIVFIVQKGAAPGTNRLERIAKVEIPDLAKGPHCMEDSFSFRLKSGRSPTGNTAKIPVSPRMSKFPCENLRESFMLKRCEEVVISSLFPPSPPIPTSGISREVRRLSFRAS